MKATTRQLEWAAGFLEGEGSFIGVNRWSEHVSAKQVNGEPIGKLRKMFGGSVELIPAHSNHQEILRWYATGARARGIMMTLYPLLSKKRQEQILKALKRQ